MMKFINVFLLLLILIGIGAFATESMWVPKLVAKIIASESVPPTLVETSDNILNLKKGEQCYSYDQVATKETPYSVKEKLEIDFDGVNITGLKTGTQNGPDMNNGYYGYLEGGITGNTINLIFSYSVEGSSNKEKEIYEVNKTGLVRLRYPLVEEAGVLVPDISKEFKTMIYNKVACE